MSLKTANRAHLNELKSQYNRGMLSRREFIRYAALVGIGAGAASQMVGINRIANAFAGTVQRGGTFKVSCPIYKLTHPAQTSWLQQSNLMRQIGEYLTVTDHNNITHPLLLQNWEVSEDLKTWTLNIRQGVRFNNGDGLTAADVIFTMRQWFDKDVGSSIKGLMGDYLDENGIEKVSDYQVKLHLKRPEIGVPEHLFHYPAIILNHRTFEGDFIKRPHGTGPFTIDTYREGERAVVKARGDYWRKGADGKPLPYLDRIEYTDMGTEMAAQISAIEAGDIDFIDIGDAPGTDVYTALKENGDIVISAVPSAQTRVLRMRVDRKPWDDNRVRLALKLCQHHEKIRQLAFYGQGLLGQDTHVYQKHPEYCDVQTPAFNPEKARQLLKEAGYPGGVEVPLSISNGWPDVVRYAEILQEDARAAGFKIKIQTMPSSQYWEKWTEVAFGITPWTHRPLGTMVLNLAYTHTETGEPVPWNETRWVDTEFSELLDQANRTLDVAARREIFCRLEKIQMERGSIGIPYWRNIWFAARKQIRRVQAHPSGYTLFNEVWKSA